jgi:dTDP-4-dehydrorhamnose 3,5-epimerase
VIVDLRKDSPTYLKWHGVELSAANRTMLYVPRGFAHGYQALTDDCEVLYLVTEFYTPGAERGLRWNDPAIGIRWPIADPILSPKDAVHEDYVP